MELDKGICVVAIPSDRFASYIEYEIATGAQKRVVDAICRLERRFI